MTTLAYRDLPLREDRNAPVDPEAAGKALAAAMTPLGRAFFGRDDASVAWLARFDLASRMMPEFDWPTLEADDWPDLIALACQGKRSQADVHPGSLLAILKGKLSYAQNRHLDEQVPDALAVPSGNRIKLTYATEGPPVLAVRLQELFGWTDTPRIAGGRVAVVLHLLGPNYRPVQITDDLKSFWSGAYFQVRKDLRARYPKHSWPDDPLKARPEARGGRRRD